LVGAGHGVTSLLQNRWHENLQKGISKLENSIPETQPEDWYDKQEELKLCFQYEDGDKDSVTSYTDERSRF
jgi:hypothetical protein